MQTTVSISYNPANLADFLSALAAVKELPDNSVSVSVSSGYDRAIARYCELRKQKRYMRLAESSAAGLTALQDLQKRAEQGDEMAVEALQELPDEIPQEQLEFPEPPICQAPIDGKVF